MVDIARVAFIYLLGGMYLDTDMDLGPRTFSRQGACWQGAPRLRCHFGGGRSWLRRAAAGLDAGAWGGLSRVARPGDVLPGPRRRRGPPKPLFPCSRAARLCAAPAARAQGERAAGAGKPCLPPLLLSATRVLHACSARMQCSRLHPPLRLEGVTWQRLWATETRALRSMWCRQQDRAP